MKRFLLLPTFLMLAAIILAEEARLLRFPAINQNQIVFTYAGDIYTVPHEGGIARKLTSHEGLEIFPRFSPDGNQIAFTGQYDGNTEVYLIPSEGGIPQRLTYTATLGRDDLADRMGPNNIVLNWTPDGQIVYRSRRHSFNAFKGQLFKVSPEGGLSTRVEVPEGGFLSFSPDGKKMAYNRVFREFRTWKYYQGGMADEIWIHDFETRETHAITDNPAQDIIPMWIGEEIFFLSDRDRTMNLFVYNTRTKETEKVTHFDEFDIKFPSHFQNHIVFENGGYIYKMDVTTRNYAKVSVKINNDKNHSRVERVDASERIFSADLSPNGERVLFSARGEIFSVPADKGITYNLTRTSGVHERNGIWSPDGSKIAWLSDKSGEYEIWVNDVYGGNVPRQLTTGGDVYKFNIAWSPDSRMIAWNDQSFKLYVTDVSNGRTRELAENNLGPINDFSWSPDSKWLTYTHWNDNRMGIVKIINLSTGNIDPVTDKWHHSYSPVFSADGKYLLFASDRSFSPIYSSTEWNHAYINMAKIYMVLLSSDTPSPFAPQNAVVKTEEKKKNDEEKKETDVRIDFAGIGSRIVELPIEPARYFNISCVNNRVYYNRMFQGGREGNGLMMYDLNEKKEQSLGDYRYTISANNNKMLVGRNKTWRVIDLPTSTVQMENTIDLSGMVAVVNYREEWQQIFDEAWRQMRDFFYVDNMHGVDWDAIYKQYSPHVRYVNHRTDLNYVIGEMIGELNAGHAYVNPGDQPQANRIPMGLLGARFSQHESGYFRIDHILEGANWSSDLQSPLNAPGVNVSVGEYIVAVNRVPTESVNDIYELLKGTAGKTVELTISNRPSTSNVRHVLVTPIADESGLYYYEWVQNNIRKVHEATNGQVGYLHIPDMGPGGLNEFVKHFYPQLHKKALIIDDRGNGGGNVSPMILERLSRVPYRVNMRRNSNVVSTIPAQTLAGPMVALVDKYSASDGDLFAHGFKALGLGTVIGTTTWGGIVGITGSLPFIDGTDLRIPQFTSLSMEGNWMIEGVGVEPDIFLENDPYKEFSGEDEQLNKAIEVILKKLKEREELPTIPSPPVKN
ncbi:S41 family peptidase [Natronoflexus pectinivorans]|uniref:Tricorn protease homolog n=1 Tax=Natronoflexus pectinivorans TaxID=682526 RepID=A0A4R2GKQ3_9BACT|nr:S41 family peptidase [Natronoflexus pectinivorans]TCO09156.1 tricorn protease [Natronoflexus pectinivorans]